MKTRMMALCAAFLVSPALASADEIAKDQLIKVAGGKSEALVQTSVVKDTKQEVVFPPNEEMEAKQEQAPATGGVALWGVVEKKGGEARLPGHAQEVVAVRTWGKGILWDQHDYVTCIVKVAPQDAGAFQSAGFAPLSDISIRMTWHRRTYWWDGHHRRAKYQYRTNLTDAVFAENRLDAGFQLMRDFMTDSLSVLARYPQGNSWVRAPVGTPYAGELGYVVDSSISIRTGHVWTENEALLFIGEKESAYFSR